MTASTKHNLFLFLSVNTIAACVGMFYFIYVQPEGAIGHVLPSYFFAVIAVYIVIYATKPEAMKGFFTERRVYVFILLLVLGISLLLLPKQI